MLPSVMSSLQKNPTQVFIAMSTIDVGVATFSLILNKMHKIENEQISTPLPVHALKVPPITPKSESIHEIIISFLKKVKNDCIYVKIFLYHFKDPPTCEDK